MLDALSSNFLLIGAMICLVLIVGLTLYKPKAKPQKDSKIDKERQLKELEIASENIKEDTRPEETLDFSETPYDAKKDTLKEEILPKEPVEVKFEEEKVEPLRKEEVDPKFFEDDGTYVYEKIDFNESEKKNDLDNIINKMSNDNKNPKTADEFEDVQEKDAIISYKELQKAKEENRINIYGDEDEENSLKEDAQEYKDELVDIDFSKKDETDGHHFKPSAIISPVTGKVDAELEYQKIPNFKKDHIEEKDTDTIITEEDYTNDEEFLKSLIDFRKNLN